MVARNQPSQPLTDDDTVIKSEYKENKQMTLHVAQYHKEWIDEVREESDSSFNMSGHVRDMLDVLIHDSEHDLPEHVTIPKEESDVAGDKSGIAVFITED